MSGWRCSTWFETVLHGRAKCRGNLGGDIWLSGEEVTGDWGKLRERELHGLFS